jgi:hypothetical protein
VDGNVHSGLVGAAIVGHANGRVLIYSKYGVPASAGVTKDDGDDLEAGSDASAVDDAEQFRLKWKKQREDPQNAWLRIKVCSVLDEMITGLYCDGTDLMLTVGNRRALKITVRRRASVMTFPFTPCYRSQFTSYTKLHKYKVLCGRGQSPGYCLDLETQVDKQLPLDTLSYMPETYISDYNGKYAALVTVTDDDDDEFIKPKEVFLSVEKIPSETPSESGEKGSLEFGTEVADGGNDRVEGVEGEEDREERLVLAYEHERRPWGFQFLGDAEEISVIEADQFATVYNIHTWQEVYPTCHLPARILSYCTVAAKNASSPNNCRTGMIFVCRDFTVKIWKEGALVSSKRLLDESRFSFAMGYPYHCAFDPVYNCVFFNDDNAVWCLQLEDDAL